MTKNERKMLMVLKGLIKAKENAENDECYSLNVGIHNFEIGKAFDRAKSVVKSMEKS
jgi:hypothetical protein